MYGITDSEINTHACIHITRGLVRKRERESQCILIMCPSLINIAFVLGFPAVENWFKPQMKFIDRTNEIT